MSASKVLFGCWLALVTLSVGTVVLAHAGPLTPWLAAGVLALALGKAWLIADRFMELRHGPRFWRGLLLSWPVIMTLGVLGTIAAGR